MVGLAEGELGSSSQTHSLASNKSRWDRRVVDSSDVTKEEGTIKQWQMMAAGAQMKETVDVSYTHAWFKVILLRSRWGYVQFTDVFP